MDVRELDFDLPEDLIAQEPLPERDAARLLVLDRASGEMEHRAVLDLPGLLRPSLLVVNDTRVIPARLFATKPSGGRVELLLLERTSERGERESWTALARGVKSLRVGMRLRIADGFDTIVDAIEEGGEVRVSLEAAGGVDGALAKHGRVPLPPYVRRDASALDEVRYQTVFARSEGSVAAPTAGLHFSEALRASLEAAGHRFASVTLHVGPGTFAPLRTENLDEHPMHEERWSVPSETARAIAEARAVNVPVVAIGTTVARTLESSAASDGIVHAGEGRTRLFVRPPYTFRAIDALFTNFHLPRSTLLALVMSLGGIEHVRRAYAEAIAARYRFFSYGDAMLIRGAEHARQE